MTLVKSVKNDPVPKTIANTPAPEQEETKVMGMETLREVNAEGRANAQEGVATSAERNGLWFVGFPMALLVRVMQPLVVILDNASIHTAKALALYRKLLEE